MAADIFSVVLVIVAVWLTVMLAFHIGRHSLQKYPLGILEDEKPKRPNPAYAFMLKYPLITALLPTFMMLWIVYTIHVTG